MPLLLYLDAICAGADYQTETAIGVRGNDEGMTRERGKEEGSERERPASS